MDKDRKRNLVRFMGGKCMLCGYNKCLRALHFHHLNPHEKEFDISTATNWTQAEVELEKCVLLCSNCHMEVHEGMVDHELLVTLKEG